MPPVIVAATGITGFLGRRVALKALERGWRVRGLARAAGRAVPRGVEAVPGDLSSPAAAASLLRGADVFVHLAALGVQSRDRDWAASIATNALYLQPWLQAALDAGVRRMIVIGTSLEYRGHGTLPGARWEGAARLCGEDCSLESSSPYGATKAAGGLLARAWARTHDVGLWYLRLPSMYGPDDDPAKFVPSAVRAASRGEAFPMTAGEQVREWLWVDDAAEAIVLAAGRDPEIPRTVNVGTGEGVSLVSVAESAFRLADRPAGLVRPGAVDYRAGEVHHLVMDPSLAQGLLGWRPRTTLDDGLRALVDAARATG